MTDLDIIFSTLLTANVMSPLGDFVDHKVERISEDERCDVCRDTLPGDLSIRIVVRGCPKRSLSEYHRDILTWCHCGAPG
jgi:hypothetical protein